MTVASGNEGIAAMYRLSLGLETGKPQERMNDIVGCWSAPLLGRARRSVEFVMRSSRSPG